MNISFNFIKSYLKTSISAFSPIIPLKHLILYLLVRLIHSLSIDSRWISNFLSKKTQFLNALFSELLPTLGRLGGGKTSKNGILAALSRNENICNLRQNHKLSYTLKDFSK